MRDDHSLRLLEYIYNSTSILNFGALYSDGTENFCSPSEPAVGDDIVLKFRTASDNVDGVYVVVNDTRYEMHVVETTALFDYYQVVLPHVTERIRYYYEIHAGRVVVYYNRVSKHKDLNRTYDFEICPGFHTPDWAKGAVFYQIYVDRFCNGDPSNDVLTNEYSYIGQPVKHVRDWNRYPENMDVGNFYGGDLQGVINKLDYLKNLGVDAIYLNPIFVSPSNHKYDIQDYDYVDPHFGKIVKDTGDLLPADSLDNTKATRYITRVTDKENLEASNQVFITLVEEAHKRGMKVILDGVFNHCGSFNKWMDKEKIYDKNPDYPKGAYLTGDSPYRKYFRFQDENAWPDNGSYNGWWGHDTLPKLNYEESKELYDYILDIGRKWVSPPFNADGWRLDVAADLGYSEEFNHRFWRDFRKAVKQANPEAIILAEHYGDPKAWLLGDQWDTVMNYSAFMEPITWFLTGVEKHSDEFRGDFLGNSDMFIGSMRHYMSTFMAGSLQVAMNELSNHDHSRFLTRTNRRVGRIHTLGPEAANEDVNKGIFRQAVVFQMTWPGAPTIYYGDEAGVAGWTDPDSRRTYPWGHEDHDLINFHREMIRIHKQYDALMKGSLVQIHSEFKCIAYGRFTRKQAVAVVINSDYNDKKLLLHIRHMGVPNNRTMRRIMLTTEEGYSIDSQTIITQNNQMSVVVPKMSAVVYVCNMD